MFFEPLASSPEAYAVRTTHTWRAPEGQEPPRAPSAVTVPRMLARRHPRWSTCPMNRLFFQLSEGGCISWRNLRVNECGDVVLGAQVCPPLRLQRTDQVLIPTPYSKLHLILILLDKSGELPALCRPPQEHPLVSSGARRARRAGTLAVLPLYPDQRHVQPLLFLLRRGRLRVHAYPRARRAMIVDETGGLRSCPPSSCVALFPFPRCG
jgi:hypothetical protein